MTETRSYSPLADLKVKDELGFNGFPVSLNYFSAVPDISSLSNPNLSILFKSLLKKDIVTKEKSANELLAFVQDLNSDSFIRDEAFILSWIQLYAKLSTENMKNVRVLSHRIQATILNKIGGKAFAKYLQTVMPLWLQGVFDTEKAVASITYRTLLECFQNDSEKVNSRVWINFSKSIINFCFVVITQETHESLSDQRYVKESDSKAKYERVLTCSLLMLNKLISLVNSEKLKLAENSAETEELRIMLSLEILWDSLHRASSVDTLNCPLFKSFLVLIKSLFSMANDSNHLLLHLGLARKLYKIVSKNFIKIKFRTEEKAGFNTLVYTSVILQFWDTLLTLTKFSLESKVLSQVGEVKNFWILGGSRSFPRLLNFLKVGHCNLNPIYYNIVAEFFLLLLIAIPDHPKHDEFLVFTDPKAVTLLVKETLCDMFSKELRDDFRQKCLECILRVILVFSQRSGDNSLQQCSEALEKVLYTLLNLNISSKLHSTDKKSNSIIQTLGQFMNQNASLFEVENFFNAMTTSVLAKIFSKVGSFLESDEKRPSDFEIVKRYIHLLACCWEKVLVSRQSLDIIVEKLKNVEAEKDVNESLFLSTVAYLLTSEALNSQRRQAICEIIGRSFCFLNSSSIESSLYLFSSLLSKKESLQDYLDFNRLSNEYFTQILACDSNKIPYFLLLLTKDGTFEILDNKESFPRIYDYLIEYSSKNDLLSDDLSVLKEYSNDPLIFKNLLSTCLRNKNTDLFIKSVLNFSSLNPTNIEKSYDELLSLAENCWLNITEKFNADFLTVINFHSENLFKESLFRHVINSSVERDFSSVGFFLLSGLKEDKHKWSSLPIQNLIAYVKNQTIFANPNLLAISSPLRSIYLVNDTTFEFGLTESLLVVGAFFYEIRNAVLHIPCLSMQVDYLVTCGILAEYAGDYPYLLKAEKLSDMAETKANEVHHNLVQYYEKRTDDLNYLPLFDQFNENQGKQSESFSECFFNKIISAISKPNGYNGYDFYVARQVRFHFSKAFKEESLLGFESKVALSPHKLMKRPLLSMVFIMSLSKFSNNYKVLRIRDYFVAEILGIKDISQAISHGLFLMTLSVVFFGIGMENQLAGPLIPLQRLILVLDKFVRFLDSEASYEKEAIPLRTQMTIFLNDVLDSDPHNLPGKLWDLLFRLVNENLEIAQGEASRIELRYYTLKLILSSKKYTDPSSSLFHEYDTKLRDNLLSLLLSDDVNTTDSQFSNQPVNMTHELMYRIFTSTDFPLGEVKDVMMSLYNLLEKLKFIVLQRIAATLIISIISRSQQDFVIEYQLNKGNLKDKNNDNEQYYEGESNIPSNLLDTSKLLGDKNFDFLEFENPTLICRVLWSWCLIFEYFKEATYSIRDIYASQLRNFGAIEKLLDYIFQQIDISGDGILRKVLNDDYDEANTNFGTNMVQNYTIEKGIPGETIKSELEVVFLHLLYLSFQYLVLDIQKWYNNIRDLQLKFKVEKFSVKYLSPVFITKIMDEVSNAKKALTGKNNNMTIKISRITHEIRAVYAIDEQNLEMVIKIPENFPLVGVTVEGPLRVGVKENQWRAWLLASQRIISLTNGSVINAIELFSKNAHLHFSGFEECAICYSVLHQDNSLPSKTCPTCKNKFHAACLYKWFKSSSSSACPLCRSSFNFKPSPEVAN